MIQRTIARRIDLAPPKRGQFGPDHQVVEVITPAQWAEQDPFILLMDDRLDGTLRAGPHPHAGFETVTFPLVGGMDSEGGDGHLAPGDVEWTTAGSGIVHGPAATVSGRFRILQLWLTLPASARWTEPDNQIIRADDAPVRREGGAELRLYSGRSGDVTSATRNRVPVILADVRLPAGARIAQELPASFNGFLYVIEGAITAGGVELRPGQVGWLDRPTTDGVSELVLEGREAARVLLYAGERQNVSLVSYGPFIGESEGDIVRSIERYKTGTFRDYTVS
jgi:redox-sensitive bicupin YhaK (pirin superfamily)